MKFSISSLLRRTLIVAGALLALAVAAPAAAVQTVTLSGQTAVGSCTYTGSITVLPDGTLSITCVPTSSTNAFFTLSYPSQLAINTTDTSSVKVTRSGGTGAAIRGSHHHRHWVHQSLERQPHFRRSHFTRAGPHHHDVGDAGSLHDNAPPGDFHRHGFRRGDHHRL